MRKIVLFLIIPITLYMLLPSEYMLYAMLIGVAFGLTKILYQAIKWYSSVYILTDKNLIYIHWHSPIKQDVVRIHYEDIETIEVHVSTLVQNIFSFGHLEVKTSNNTNNKTLYYASRVNRAQSKLADIQDEKIQEKSQKEVSSLKKAFSESLKELAHLRH